MKSIHSAISGFFLIAILFSGSKVSYAQIFEWGKSFGSVTAGDNGQAIAVDPIGNVYTSGLFWSTVDFDPGPGVTNLTSAGNRDVFITKMSEAGNLIWAKRMGGISSDLANGMTVDADGNVYTTGQNLSSSGDYDPGAGVFTLTNYGNVDIFISKLDSSGNFVWAKSIGSPANDFSYGIATDAVGNVYISGLLSGSFDFDPGPGTFNLTSAGSEDLFILKLDPAGNFLWAKALGGTGSESGGHIAVDASGNVFSTGSFSGTADFDPNAGIYNLTSTGSTDGFISKLNAAGNFVWAYKIGGTGGDAGKSICLGPGGDIYILGNYTGTGDFDPGPSIFNLTGISDIYLCRLDGACNLLWAKSIGGPTGNDWSKGISTDPSGNVFATGYFYYEVDFDPGPSTYNITPFTSGFSDAFFVALDPLGNFLNAQSLGGSGADLGIAIASNDNGTYATGSFEGTVGFPPPSTIPNLVSAGMQDGFIVKYLTRGVIGYAYNDINSNCILESEPGLSGRNAIINPGGLIVQTGPAGNWFVDSLPAGVYTITFDTSGSWTPTCPVTQNFTVTDPDALTNAANFGMVSLYPCSQPAVSVTALSLRRCFTDQKIYITAQNLISGTGTIPDAYVELQLDSLLSPLFSSIPYTSLGDNRYRFDLDSLNPGEAASFWMSTQVSCAAVLGQTLCMDAYLFPADSCSFDSIPSTDPADFSPCALPWDQSSLHVNGWCDGQDIYYEILNTGGNMACYAPVRLFIDGTYIWLDSIMLNGGDRDTLTFSGDGRTWRLEVDQHPLHPGDSHPNATIERCGDTDNWTANLVNVLPPDDADPVIDIYCGLVTGSYDPNDKTGYPLGLGSSHHISPDGELEYLIRFQNTGTDTAFTVVIQDTLDTDLNIFTLVPGASSHNYTFSMHGPRVLEWTFENILLPDSTADEAGSHGFLTFTVEQNANLAAGTEINNTAYIYFDFNAPVITNTTSHIIEDDIQQPEWSVQTTVNETNCSAVVYNGISYTQSGTYWQVKNGAGTDTLVTIHVTILNVSYSSFAVSACDSYTAPDGVIHTTSGIKTATLTNSIGCDSIILIHLTVNYTSSIDTTISQAGLTLTSNAVADSWQWLDCSSGTPIAGETNQNYTASTNGSYAVEITVGGCFFTTSCYTIASVGLESSQESKVIAYPNPTAGNLSVSFGEIVSEAELSVLNVMGQEILHKQVRNETAIDLYLQGSNGLYFLKITSGANTSYYKIVKQ